MENITFQALLTDVNDIATMFDIESISYKKNGQQFTVSNEVYNYISNEFKVKKVTKGSNGKIYHKNFTKCVNWLSLGWAIYLHGPAGTGKSQIAKMLAEHFGVDFYPESTLLSQYDLTNFVTATGTYEESNFYKAFKYGGLFFLDEFDGCAADVPIKLNGALANGWFKFPNGEVVKKHDKFMCVCAGNTVGLGATEQYVGRTQMDAATLNRFRRIKIDYDRNIELLLAKNDEKLVEFIEDFREAVTKCNINHIVSYREIQALVDGLTFESIGEAIADALSADEDCLGIDNMKSIYWQMKSTHNKYTREYAKVAGI